MVRGVPGQAEICNSKLTKLLERLISAGKYPARSAHRNSLI
jgi:hypothetical protein